jgi:hypothetical protein
MTITLTLTAIDDVLLQCRGGDNVILEGSTTDFFWAGAHHVKFWGIVHGNPGSWCNHIQGIVTGEANPVYIKIHGPGGNDGRIPLYYYPGSVPVWTEKQYAVGDIVIGHESGLGYEDVYRCISAHYGQDSDRPVSGLNWGYRWVKDNNNAKDTGERTFLINKTFGA